MTDSMRWFRVIAAAAACVALVLAFAPDRASAGGKYGYKYGHGYKGGKKFKFRFGVSYGYRPYYYKPFYYRPYFYRPYYRRYYAYRPYWRYRYFSRPKYYSSWYYAPPPRRSVYAAPPPPARVYTRPPAPPPQARPVPRQNGCLMIREYQTKVVVGGKSVDAYGDACMQPDGSWRRGPPKLVPQFQ